MVDEEGKNGRAKFRNGEVLKETLGYIDEGTGAALRKVRHNNQKNSERGRRAQKKIGPTKTPGPKRGANRRGEPHEDCQYHEFFPEVPFVRCGSIESAGMEFVPFARDGSPPNEGLNEGIGLVS